MPHYVKLGLFVVGAILLIKLMYPVAVGAACAYLAWHVYKNYWKKK